jgi:hydroxymethylpyrimidine pyrophosphatase-like HAD family hydrolase
LKIRALFCDYDGTLAPLGVSRSRSRIPASLAKTLTRIHESIPVAIVTAKDYAFIRSRTPFADAWSCVYGIETVVKNGEERIKRPLRDLSAAVSVVKGMPYRPLIEYKKTSSGEVCGFGVEWKRGKTPATEVVVEIVSRISALGLQVVHDSLYPMFDVIQMSSDKGVAVRVLQRMLRINEGLMFVGDSRADDPAFAVADVGIGVLGALRQPILNCDYFVRNEHLDRFLSALLENELEFSESLPCIRSSGVPS